MTGARKQRRNRSESGFFTIWTLGLCMIVFFIGGLSLDLWRGFTERRQLAAIADAASIAGAAQLDLDKFRQSPSVVTLDPQLAAARADAYLVQAANDANIDLTNHSINVVGNRIDVTAESRLNMTLAKVLSPDQPFNVRVHSSAEPRVAP